MRFRKFLITIILIINICFLVSCETEVQINNGTSEFTKTNNQKPIDESDQEENDSEDQLEVVDGCIQPYETFAYKSNPDPTKPWPGHTDIVGLNTPWNIETVIDTETFADELPWSRSQVLGVRSVNRKSEIWIENRYYDNLSTTFHQTLSIYQPTTKQWELIDVDFGVDAMDYSYISDLFFGLDGSIWGAIKSISITDENNSISILSKFNEKEKRFEFDPNVRVIPRYSNPLNYSRTFVLFDNNGIFWFVVPGDSIYRYSPQENTISHEFSIASLDIYSASISSDNSILLLTYFPQSLIAESEIYRYSTMLHQFNKISLPEEIRYSLYSQLYEDDNNNLWLDSAAWMEPNGEWVSVIQPTIFISNFAEGLVPRWRVPDIKYETSDQRLWFVGDNGSTWLDRDTHKWCWFTTYQVVPIEDEGGKLWIVVNDHLYWSEAINR
jgi:hypothetical protein